MLTTVRDDRRRQRMTRGGCWTRVGLMLAAALVGVVPHSVAAQQGGGDFEASVLDLSGQVQRVTVPLNGSVSVGTSIEVTRADVINTQVVDVQILSPTRLLMTGQRYGTSSVVLLGTNGEQFVFEVAVEIDLSRLNEAIRKVDPLSDAKAESVFGNIVLTGTVSSAERAARITDLASLFVPPGAEGAERLVQNHMDVAGEQQVLLRVTVAEINRAAARELGINGFLAGENAQDAFLVNQIGGINPSDIGAAGNFPLYAAGVPLNRLFQTGDDGIPITQATTLSLGFPKIQMQVFMRALAENSLLKILAEPNLTAISGETATFLAGGEFPIPVPQGLQQVTVEFREFGVQLNFTPIVRGNGMIRLRVAPEVSELDFTTAVQIEGFVIPGLTTRASETTVEVGNGQTIAIAGLLNERVRGLTSRVPGIGDVPILGALFRSVEFQRSLTELVILVTPEIAAPIDAHQKVPQPGEDSLDPSAYELYLLGLLEGRQQADASAANDLAHEVSFASEPDNVHLHGPWGHAGPSDMK